jgi:hypothetical protein
MLRFGDSEWTKIEAELQAAAAFLGPLRRGEGIDVASATRLKAALQAAAQARSDSETISKSAANLFVDLRAGSRRVGGDEGNHIMGFADEVADLVRACVSIPCTAR